MKLGNQIEKVSNLIKSIDNLEGVPISFPIIKNYIHPLKNYLVELYEELNDRLESDSDNKRDK